jgi:hypothetical protein
MNKKIVRTAIEIERAGLTQVKVALEERLLNINIRLAEINKEMEDDGKTT